MSSLNATPNTQQDDKCDDVVYFLLMTNLGIETHLCYVVLASNTKQKMTPNTSFPAIYITLLGSSYLLLSLCSQMSGQWEQTQLIFCSYTLFGACRL